MALITPFEVLKYSPAGNTYPTGKMCDLIPQIEQEFGRDCLGKDLLDYLEGHLMDIPPGVEEYSGTETYNEGDVVKRNGCLYVSDVNGNTSDPLNETGDWLNFKRFDNEASNELWEKYLRRILALKVFMASLIYTTWRAGAGGLTINSGDPEGVRSANKAEMSDMKTGILAEIERTTANMLDWLNANAEDLEIPLAYACKNLCQTPGRRVRRWAWKH